MEKEDEEFGTRFPDVKPGWVYDSNNRVMISMNSAFRERTPLKFDYVSLNQRSLNEMLNWEKGSTEYIWQKDFKNSSGKNCFFRRVTSSYTDFLNRTDDSPRPIGTITKVNYRRSIAVLVCSDDESAFEACSSYIKDVIAGAEAKLDEKTCESCKKCFMYDGYLTGNVRSFDSIMHCLKEMCRIIDETKNYENFLVSSWMYLKESSFKHVVKSLGEPSANEMLFYSTKLFNTANNNCQSVEYSPAQHSFGDDSSKINQIKLSLKENSRDVNIIGLHNCVSAVKNYSDTNIPLTSTSINEANNTYSSTSRTSACGKGIFANNSSINVNKDFAVVHNAPSGKNTSANKFSNVSEVIEFASKSSLNARAENKAMHRTMPSNLSTQIDKKNSTSNINNKTSSVLMNVDDARHSSSINIPVNENKKVVTADNNKTSSVIMNADDARHSSSINIPVYQNKKVATADNNKTGSVILNADDAHHSSSINIPVNENKKVVTADNNKTSSVIMNADNARHSPINIPVNENKKGATAENNKTNSVIMNAGDARYTSSINESVPEDKTKGLVSEVPSVCCGKSNLKGDDNLICKMAKEHINNKNCEKQTQKRTTVAERMFSNCSSILESDSSDQRQIKKHKGENFIEYRGTKILQTVVEENGIRKIEIGSKTREHTGKVIVLLGATGSGKSSIVNLCANYYFGAKTADEEKLFIVESKIKTDRVTIYTFYPEVDNQIPLTIVDTPGLNDSTGAEIHDHVDALKSFLALACTQGLKINAICFVVQAHLVRLTSSEKLVMDYVKSLFGSEVEKHIVALVTFSDNQPTPPVIEAMEQYGFKSPFFVKFNNTLLISKAEEVDDLDKIYWRTGLRSWKKCLKHLSTLDSLSNVAISSVKNEVFNKSVLNKYTFSLEGEIRNFIMICKKKKTVQEFYNDKELHYARKKVWMASNDAYNVESNTLADTKEIFLINACQLQLKNEKITELSAVIKLFLLLDDESTLRCVIKKLVAALVQCLNIFNNHPKAEENCLIAFCNGCDRFCIYRKSWDNQSSGNVIKFYCKCKHSSGYHGPPSDDSNNPPLPFVRKQNLYFFTAHSIKKEISKYDGLNSGVASLWTVGQILRNLQLNEPDEYCNKRMAEIFVTLCRLS